MEASINNSNLLEEKKFNRNKWFFAVSGIGRDMVYGLVANYFFMYVQFGLTLSVAQFATLSILIGVLGRIWDGINDPLMGTIIDACHFKMGKFKPWILFGAILTGLLLLVLFNIRPFGTEDIYGWIYVGIMVVVYLLWEAAFTMNDIGYWGAIPSLSPDKKKRDSLTSLVIFFAGVGGGAVTLFVGTFSPGNILNAYTLYSIVACIAMILFQGLAVLKVEEGPIEEKDENEKSSLIQTFKIIFKNKQLLWLALGYLIYDIASGILGALIYNLYYLEYGYDGSLGTVIIAMGVITMILQALYPKITKNLSRKQIQKYAFILMTAGYTWIGVLGWTNVLPFNPITLSIGYLLTGIGGTYFYITSLINLTNCVEYNEYLTGKRNEAIISSVRPLIVKFATAAKSLITTLVLICSGLYILSQDISNLETQKNLFNDKITSIEEAKEYVHYINYYASLLEEVSKDSNEYNDLIASINEEINTQTSNTLKKVQVNPEYIDIYKRMYILKYSDGKIIDHKTIHEISKINLDDYFNSSCTYEASFVFSYNDNNDKVTEKVDINLATDIYKESDSLDTKIIMRVMVTIVPVVLIYISYYIQNYKFIVDEKYYDEMIKKLNERRTLQHN